MRKLLATLTSAALLLSLVGPVSAVGPKVREKGHNTDNIPSSLSERQAQLKQAAQDAVLAGTATPQGANQVVKVAPGQYAELAFQGSDNILTLLAEFGEGDDPTHGGTRSHVGLHDPDGNATDGPLHNEIAAPDRAVDNVTIWEPDFSRDYYDNLLYNRAQDPSMANFYLELSSGRYTVDGMVGDWVQVPFNAANYGSNYCGGIVCQDTWFFVKDQVTAWYQSLLDSGKSAAEIDSLLADYDVWDRYDHDGDGNFNEPDGYIDHFQSVHAGEGEETGGGAQGSDAIWSHRWYVQLTRIGAGGPTVDGEVVPFGGVQLGGSKYWIGDYTIEPENGGVGVFAHEFAHDLGLPDLYDTSGNTGGAENSTGFWTLMSSGSYGSTGIPADGIGTRPMHMGAWEKFQLGWLNYDVVRRGKTKAIRLGPASTNTRQAQGAFVILPRKSVETSIGLPYQGANFYYSGAGDDLDNMMFKSVTLGSGSTLTAKVRYGIELDWDYAYVVVSTDGGATWTGVETNLSTDTDPNGQNFGNGITGSSNGNWVDLTADLSPYTGSVLVGFRYWTDGAVVEPGISIDDISIAGGAVDGAESDAGWTFDPVGGFRVSTGTEIATFPQYYVLENRQYRGYDDSLRTGPYNFGFLNTLPDWVEHFNYEDGLLISLWDTSHTDNNVGDHPGEGLILPIDAHPDLEHWSDTELLLRPRLLARDSTFGFEPVPSLTLHNNGVATVLPAKPAISVFDDTKTWWYDSDDHGATGAHPGRYQPGWASVNPPNTGTTIRIIDISPTGFWQVEVVGGR